jgi:hypothetical protein
MATITLPPAKVIEAAEKTIQHIKDTRKREDEEAIAETTAKRRLGWRGFYHMNREQAIKYLDESDMWGWRSCYAGGDLQHAKDLLRLAKNGDPVTLNEKDCRVLF